MISLLAISSASTWGLQEWFIAVIILAAVIGIVYLALREFGIVVPAAFGRILMIVVVAVIAVLAIRFLFTL